MKKKLLSLVLAGAMVASTSVSAFAADTIVTTDGQLAPVTIKGSVNGDGDKPAPGTLSVTVPTTLSFAVKNNGSLDGTYIRVQNDSSQAIDVYAYEFTDRTNDSGITVYKEGETLNKKSDVILKLSGNHGVASFKSETQSEKNNGVYTLAGEKASGNDGVLVSNILNGQHDDLNLEGQAGTTPIANATDGVSDTFTLRLKIKRA